MGHISGGIGSKEIKTFAVLDQIRSVLGGSAVTHFGFLESHDNLIKSAGNDLAQQHFLEPISNGPGFDAYRHAGGVHSYLFDPNYAMYLLGEDSTNYRFGNGSEDEPFSLGMWIQPTDLSSAGVGLMTLMAVYDDNAARQWRWQISADNDQVIEFFDETGTASEIGQATTQTVDLAWTFVVMTYDGTEGAPVIAFYQDAVADATTTTSETNTYVAMEDLGAKLTIGADLSSNMPVNVFDGRIALPFITGTALTAANVTTLYGLGRQLMGV